MGNMTSLTTLLVSRTAISKVPHSVVNLELDSSSLQDLIRVKHRNPDVLRYHLPALTQGFTSLDMGNSSVHSPPEGQSLNNCILESGDLPTRSKDLESDHCVALAIIPSSPKASRKRILQGSTANGEGGVFPNYYISPSDHSNLKRRCFNYCASLPHNGDLETSLKELESDHYTKALEVVRNFSETSRQSILQGGLTALEDGGICLSGNDFPKRFINVRKSDQVFFQVPQIIGCNLKALTVRVVCSLYFSGDDMSPKRRSIFVTNHTKLVCVVVRPAYPTEITSLHEVIWQGHLSNNQLRLEGHDFVEVEVVAGAGLRVKETGVSLAWDPNLIIENMIECEPIPYENFRSDADNQAGPSNDS
ncbi:PREDICTED: uncharacterized protein LOC101303838 [Fragaria vesca subsp. vesca]